MRSYISMLLALASSPVEALPPARSSLTAGPQRLGGSRAIRGVLGAGVRVHGPSMVLHARRRPENPDHPARVAVVAGRKVGGAVERNRAKRRLRAALSQAELPVGVDVVLVARRPVLSATFPALCAELDHLIDRVGRRVWRG